MTKLVSRIQGLGLPAANISLRGLSLVARFALTLFMAKYFTLAEIGLFGLFYSATAAAPALLGFGINFFLNREIVLLPFDGALRRLRDRVAVSFACVVVVVLVVASCEAAGVIPSVPRLSVLCLILILEAVSFDIHFSLISLKRPLLANSLLFVRSALWVFPFIAAAYVFPHARNLGALLYWWLAALVASFLVLAWQTRLWPWSNLNRYAFDKDWFKKTLSRSKLIYAGDIGNVGIVSADRYILGSLNGLEQVGVFVFFWTIANSIQILVATAVSQIALPHMVEAHARGGHDELLKILKAKSLEAVVLGAGLGALALAIVHFIVPFLGHSEFGENMLLFGILLLAAVTRAVSDVWHYALYSAGKDTALAWIYILGFVGSLLASFAGVIVGGINGLAIAIAIVAILQWLARVHFVAAEKLS